MIFCYTSHSFITYPVSMLSLFFLLTTITTTIATMTVTTTIATKTPMITPAIVPADTPPSLSPLLLPPLLVLVSELKYYYDNYSLFLYTMYLCNYTVVFLYITKCDWICKNQPCECKSHLDNNKCLHISNIL